MQPQEKVVMDVAAVGTTLGSLGEWLPPVASLFTIVWMGIRIYETNTIQSLLGKETNNGHGSDQKNTD
jgi:hypothetical protein